MAWISSCLGSECALTLYCKSGFPGILLQNWLAAFSFLFRVLSGCIVCCSICISYLCSVSCSLTKWEGLSLIHGWVFTVSSLVHSAAILITLVCNWDCAAVSKWLLSQSLKLLRQQVCQWRGLSHAPGSEVRVRKLLSLTLQLENIWTWPGLYRQENSLMKKLNCLLRPVSLY